MIVRTVSHNQHYAERFQDRSVVERYHLRPTYPSETFDILKDLMVDEPHVVLDVGCGTGNIARRLVEHAEHIDAVDISEPMLDCARTLPGGDSPKIRWLHGRAEEIDAHPPYTLITAGESLHWMDWGVALPRFARFLAPQGVLAILDIADEPPVPWHDGYVQIVKRFSNNPNYVRIDLVAELEKRQLFRKIGDHKTAPISMQQTIQDYIASQHARSSLSLETMAAEQAAQFYSEMCELLSPYAKGGLLTFSVVGLITWGKPSVG